MNRKQQAFALFEQGMTAFSPEVKALRLKKTAKYSYYSEWQKSKGVLPLHWHPLGKLRGRVGKLKGRTELNHLYSLFGFTFLHFSFTFSVK